MYVYICFLIPFPPHLLSSSPFFTPLHRIQCCSGSLRICVLGLLWTQAFPSVSIGLTPRVKLFLATVEGDKRRGGITSVSDVVSLDVCVSALVKRPFPQGAAWLHEGSGWCQSVRWDRGPECDVPMQDASSQGWRLVVVQATPSSDSLMVNIWSRRMWRDFFLSVTILGDSQNRWDFGARKLAVVVQPCEWK